MLAFCEFPKKKFTLLLAGSNCVVVKIGSLPTKKISLYHSKSLTYLTLINLYYYNVLEVGIKCSQYIALNLKISCNRLILVIVNESMDVIFFCFYSDSSCQNKLLRVIFLCFRNPDQAVCIIVGRTCMDGTYLYYVQLKSFEDWILIATIFWALSLYTHTLLLLDGSDKY